MNILTLSIKQKYFDEILQARKPTNTVKSDQLTLRSISLTSVVAKNIRLMQNYLKKERLN